MQRPHLPAYPHSELTEILPDVFFVNGSIQLGAMQISRTMLVLRNEGRLTIVNSLRLGDEGLRALDALGKVTDVVRLGGFHGSDDPFYKQRDGAKSWAVAGQTYFTGINSAEGEIYFEPDAYLDASGDSPIPGASLHIFSTKVPEAILRLPAGGGTLVAADALHNWHADEFFNEAAKIGMENAGMLRPYRLGGGWLRSLKPDPKEVAGILELDFENVVPGHGQPVLGGAREKYRPAIEEYVEARAVQ